MGDGPVFAEVAHAIASAINLEQHPYRIPWKHRFRVIEPDRGARLIVEELAEQELVEVKPDVVANCVVAWMRLQNDPESLLTKAKAREVVDTWMAFADPIPMDQIKPVRWSGDYGYTWRRLPWAQKTGPTPTWDKILGKLTNAAAYRQWLGSLFFDEAAQHQYVWIHGQGSDGKGSMNDVLAKVFHKAYRSKQPPHPGDKFWTYGLLGARLVVFPDCNSQTFTTGGLFKALTGGDPVDVEAKGRMSFTARLGCKFLFLSNEKPNISCEDADMRRIIYCEFVSKMRADDKDPKFKAKLWDEAGAFLSKCIAEYVKACPNHEDIENSKDAIEEWVSVGDEKYQVFFDKLFKLPNDLYRTTAHLHHLTDAQLELVTVKPDEMHALVTNYFKDRREQAGFRDWLYKKYGVQKKSIKRSGAVDKLYVGICRLPTAQTRKELVEAVENLASRIRLGIKVVSTPSTVDTLTT